MFLGDVWMCGAMQSSSGGVLCDALISLIDGSLIGSCFL